MNITITVIGNKQETTLTLCRMEDTMIISSRMIELSGFVGDNAFRLNIT